MNEQVNWNKKKKSFTEKYVAKVESKGNAFYVNNFQLRSFRAEKRNSENINAFYL